eukprot:143821_1
MARMAEPVARFEKININGLKSQQRYLKKSKISFVLEQDRFCSITKAMITLQVFPHSARAIVTNQRNNKSTSFKCHIDSIPKDYHYLYWYLFKMIHKLRKRTTKYTIIRERELDDADKIICLITLSGAYTIHFNPNSLVYLRSKNSDIKFIRNKKTKTLPFTYRTNSKYAIHYDDAYDKMRTIVHELIRCGEIVEKQKLRQSDPAKTWKIRYNADSGSVEDIKEGKFEDNKFKYTKHCKDQEGLFKCSFESETTLSSDYNSTNSELQYIPMESKENKSLSTVPDNSFASNSIKSEASWRNNSMASINSGKSEASVNHAANNAHSDPARSPLRHAVKDERESVRRKSLHRTVKSEKDFKFYSWTKQDVCCWLQGNKHSKDVCMIFWNYRIDGKALLTLTSERIYQMFDKLKSVTNEDKKRLIASINTLIGN